MGPDREYAGLVEGMDNVELVLLSAGEIPKELAAGRINLGVTGTDLVQEKMGDWATIVDEVEPLGFGRADLVLAVPDCWVDVISVDDLDAVAAQFRVDHGFRLRIATKIPRLNAAFLEHACCGGLSVD